MRRMLAALGYRVIEAESGLSALKRFRRRFEPVHLLVTDVVMPGIAGPALAKRLREIRRAGPIVVADDDRRLIDRLSEPARVSPPDGFGNRRREVVPHDPANVVFPEDGARYVHGTCE